MYKVRTRALSTFTVRHADPALSTREDSYGNTVGLGLCTTDIVAASTSEACAIAFEEWGTMWPNLKGTSGMQEVEVCKTHYPDGQVTGFEFSRFQAFWKVSK